jgi:ribosomal protein S18 acetylase RimI-like enzyme
MKAASAVDASPAITMLEPVSRLFAFLKRHGFRATLRRSWVFGQRMFSQRMVLFYLDFPKGEASDEISTGTRLPPALTVERVGRQAEMRSEDWEKIVNFWNPKITQKQISERFGQGATLWMIRWEGRLAGYGWTITGHTIVPHYHPLGSNDVHMFDFLVFPEFRGKNVNPSLVDYILDQMTREGRTRAYIEVREWNKPQLKSLGKTKFQLLGVARKTSLLGRTFVEWIPGERCGFAKEAEAKNQSTGASLTTR